MKTVRLSEETLRLLKKGLFQKLYALFAAAAEKDRLAAAGAALLAEFHISD